MKASAQNGSESSGLRTSSLPVFGIETDDRLGFQRRRHVLDDRVEQRLHALVLEGRPAEHRQHGPFDRRLAQRRLHAIDRQFFAFEKHLQQLVVLFGNRLDQVPAPFHRKIAKLAIHLFERHSRAEIVGVDDLLHREEIDDAFELILGTDRHLDRNGAGAKALANLFDDVEEVGADAVHLVDENDPRDPIFVRLAPHGLGLRLNRRYRIEKRDQPVEDAQRAFDLDRKVHVTRRIDDVDASVAPGVAVAADVIVMPRSCSWTIQSIVAAPSCTSPILWTRPVKNRMRSVQVVLPASMCAAMPIFLVRSSGYSLAAMVLVLRGYQR